MSQCNRRTTATRGRIVASDNHLARCWRTQPRSTASNSAASNRNGRTPSPNYPRQLTIDIEPAEHIRLRRCDCGCGGLDELRALMAAAAAQDPVFDVKCVMSQVGHADSKMTMDVYAHLQQRLKRQHGEACDALIREARGADARRRHRRCRPQAALYD